MYIPASQAGTRCGCGGGMGCLPCGGLAGYTNDGSGLFGTGIFGTGVEPFNFSTWTWAEVATAGAAVFVAYAVFFTGRSGYQSARKRVRRLRS